MVEERGMSLSAGTRRGGGGGVVEADFAGDMVAPSPSISQAGARSDASSP